MFTDGEAMGLIDFREGSCWWGGIWIGMMVLWW